MRMFRAVIRLNLQPVSHIHVSCFVTALALLGVIADSLPASVLRIMPLGDSITAGYTDASWSAPFTFGYRGPLYTRLKNAGYGFQFVGASPEPWPGSGSPWVGPPMISGPDLRAVGQDLHRGYGGTVISHLLNGQQASPGQPSTNGGIVNWLNADNPDIVLLMIGINNISYFGNTGDPIDTENQLQNLVQTIVATKPEVKVIVAQIAPYQNGQNTNSVSHYNDYIRNTMVPYFAAQGNHVTTVNQYANFATTGGTVDASLYAAIAHPNVAGYDRMAETWFQGIRAATAPEPSSSCLLLGGGAMLAIRAACRFRRQRHPSKD
jgi:lysophospholipase L1-like esterase